MPQDNQLTREQRETMQKGFALEEMVFTEGWKVVMQFLEDRMYHTWIDPRECETDDDFLRREYNLFYAREAAKELITDINELIAQAHELEDIRKGNGPESPMKI